MSFVNINMGILDQLIEKKDILAYLHYRKEYILFIKKSIARDSQLLDIDREKIIKKWEARSRELEILESCIYSNKLKYESKELYNNLHTNKQMVNIE